MNVVIIEDEHFSAQKLTLLLNRVKPNINIVATLTSVEESINWFEQNLSPDLIFADIHLADENSFTLFEKINIDTPIIFTTAYDQYAIKAFKLNSIDYLLKPIDIDELKQALEQFNNSQKISLEKLKQAIITAPKTSKYKDRFLAKVGTQLKSIKTEDIAYFFTAEKLGHIQTKNNDTYIIDYTLEQLQELLSPDSFFRINRQFLISQSSITKINTHFNNRLKLDLTPHCPKENEIFVSRDRVAEFKTWLGA